MLKNSWKLCAGKFGWMPAAFLMRVILAQCYGIILRFQGNGTRGSIEHPSSTELSRTMQSKGSKVIGNVKQGMGMRNPVGSNGCSSWWAIAAASK